MSSDDPTRPTRAPADFDAAIAAAELAEQRLDTLTELAFALSATVTVDDVAQVVIERGMRHAHADIATLYALDDDGAGLDLLAHRGVAPEVLQHILRITENSGNPKVLETVAANRSVWAETEREYDALFPDVARLEASGPRAKALWSVPLVVEGRPVGLLGMGFYDEQRFSEGDRRFVETFAKLCAQALLRAIHRDRELVTRRWLATTLQSIGDAVIATDNDGKVTFMNGVAERLTGYTEAEADGQPLSNIFAIFSELTGEPVENPVTKVLREGQIVGLANHTILRAKNGTEIPIHDSGAPIRDGHGQIFGVVLVFRDVTLENQTRAREREMREQAELANTAKDHFLATVSHELRTPLNVILGWSVVLREREAPPEIARALAVIERNARAQARLIEDVLDVSRIISGKLSLSLRAVNVAEAARSAVDSMRPAADGKGISLELRSERDERTLTITADADRLQQILWNLLSNAVKFTGKMGQIALSVDRIGSEVRVTVTDSGEGIVASALPYVFEPFRQADSSTTRRHGGLGLGLALVKQIAEAHGGTVEAKSSGVGLGATFVVRLPARAATESVQRASQPDLGETSPSSQHAGALSGVRILVVDDELDARELVAEALKEAGATVALAASAREALLELEAHRPAVLVSDIGMPYEDGYLLLRKVRALSAERGGQIPALALTAYARAEDADRAYDAGYQRHVSKPVDPFVLVEIVLELLGRAQRPDKNGKR